MSQKSVKLFMLVVGIILVSTISFSCGGEVYKKVNTNKHGVSFTFECPTTYIDTGTLESDTDNVNQVILVRPFPEKQGLYDTELYIEIDDSGIHNNAKSALEYYLYGYAANNPDFKLLGRSTIKIDGIQGELAIHSMTFRQGTFMGPYLSIARDVYFDYGGQIWTIGLASHIEIEDQTKAEFDHIIKSFKFLD